MSFILIPIFMTNSRTRLHTYLRQIIKVEPNGLVAAVATEALESDDPLLFFADLQRGGCASGMVNSLVYSEDIHSFFDTHYDEIETLRTGFEESTGQPIIIRGDLKNHLAWFAFEETAVQLLDTFIDQGDTFSVRDDFWIKADLTPLRH